MHKEASQFYNNLQINEMVPARSQLECHRALVRKSASEIDNSIDAIKSATVFTNANKLVSTQIGLATKWHTMPLVCFQLKIAALPKQNNEQM